MGFRQSNRGWDSPALYTPYLWAKGYLVLSGGGMKGRMSGFILQKQEVAVDTSSPGLLSCGKVPGLLPFCDRTKTSTKMR